MPNWYIAGAIFLKLTLQIVTGWMNSVYDQLTSSQRLTAWLELNDGIFDLSKFRFLIDAKRSTETMYMSLQNSPIVEVCCSNSL